MIIPFGEWLPDLPEFSNPGALTALNVIPHSRSYKPFPALSPQSTALPARVLGGIEARDKDGNVFVYVGTAATLQEMDGSLAFIDQSKAGGYSTGSDDIWEFAQFGRQVIATNFMDPVQFILAGTGGSNDFADLITSALKPKAKHLAVVRDFLVLGHTNDATDGEQSNRIWWSAIGDAADLDPSATTQSDFQNIPEGGRVTRIIGGTEYGVVFQEKQISRLDYSGAPLVFNINPADRQRGTPVPGSVAGHGRNIFYWSEEGFHVFTGVESIPIGDGKVDDTFRDQFDITDKVRVTATIDPKNKVYMISFPGTDNQAGQPNKVFMYYWPGQKWAEADLETEIVFRGSSPGFTLETLDTISTNIDTGFTESLDSDVYKGGAYRLMAIDTDHKLGFFTGSNLAATVDTGEAQLSKGRRSLITKIRPLTDGGTSTIQVGGRRITTETVSFDTAIATNAIGECPVRNNSRYQRARVNITGTWTHAQGVEVPDENIRPMGWR